MIYVVCGAVDLADLLCQVSELDDSAVIGSDSGVGSEHDLVVYRVKWFYSQKYQCVN